ncbi:MAG: CHASE2 domain-containing protein, partial [Gammaproteobacteria bacterium]
MARRDFWSRDWFAALVFSLVFAVLAFAVLGDGFQSLERYTYDLGVRARDRAPSERIAVVAIDEESIANLGRWPWPRELQARLIDTLADGGAKVIGSTALYLEAEQSAGSARVSELGSQLRESPLVQQIPAEIETFGLMLKDAAGTSPQLAGVAQAYEDSALARDYRRLMTELVDALSAAAAGSGDETLAASLRAHGRVQLPMVFALGRPQGRPDAPLPEFVRRNALTTIHDRVGARADGNLPLPAREALAPIEGLGG